MEYFWAIVDVLAWAGMLATAGWITIALLRWGRSVWSDAHVLAAKTDEDADTADERRGAAV